MLKKHLKKLLVLSTFATIATTAIGKPVEIEYWHVASESFGGGAVKELIKEFNAKNKDIKVIEKFNPDMYKGLTQNLQIAVASGKKPAIVQIGYSYLNYAYDNFEYVTPQEVVKKHVPKDKNYFKENFLPNILELGQVDGEQVGLPYSISNPIMYINADLFKQAGIDTTKMPKDWDTVREYASMIKKNTGKIGLFVQEYADNWAHQALIEGNGGQMLEFKNGMTKPTFSSPESAEAYQFHADLVKDGLALHASNDEGFQAFLNGQVGMVITTIGKRDNFEKSANFDLVGEKFPLFKGKERKLPAGGNLLVIMSDKKAEQKAAWEFIKFLYSGSSAEKWTKGTGYLPATLHDKNSGIHKFIAGNQLMSIASAQLADMGKWASFSGPNALQAEQLLIDARDIILSGKEPAKKVLADTQKKIEKLM